MEVLVGYWLVYKLRADYLCTKVNTLSVCSRLMMSGDPAHDNYVNILKRVLETAEQGI